MITYTEEKKFTQNQMQKLFLSVGWVSGQYPSQLYKALMHYVLVHPDYQGMGITRNMVEMVKTKYRDYLYIDLMPENRNNAAFYEKHGFRIMENGISMHLCNFSNQN